MMSMTEPETDETGGDAPAESMEALLAQQAAMSEKLTGKKVAWVKVIQVTADSVLVDVGTKNEGSIPLSEFVGEAGPAESGKNADKKKGKPDAAPAGRAPAVGQRIPVMMTGSRRDGSPALSYKRAKAELGWEAVAKAHQEKARVRGIVRQAIKGGFIVDVGGVSAFLPSSLADLRPVREPQRLIGTGVRCRVIELNESKKQAVLSRKAVLEEEAGKRKAQLLDELRLGEVRIGRVVKAGPEGLLVDIGGAEGRVLPADLAWGKPPEKPAFSRGDKLRVKVLTKPAAGSADPVTLGVKQLTPNPADALKKKYLPKAIVKGTVLEAGPSGVRIEISEKEKDKIIKRVAVSALHETDPETAYKPGEQVSAVVLGINSLTLEVTVSLKRFEEARDRKRVAQYLKTPPPLTLGQLLSPEGRE